MKKIYDLVGIGFGPSNLALAIVVDEQFHTHFPLTALFLEQKATFSWHPNMLLSGAQMQISFLKDLVTLRNPTSAYTFLNYLKSVNRLSAFANLRQFYPSRIEYNDYMAWVAQHLDRHVKYNSCVLQINPYGQEPYSLLEIIYEDRATHSIHSLLARNIVIAPGGIPTISFPTDIELADQQIWHSADYLKKISFYKATPNKPYHFAVVGGGQSAAEIAYDMHQTFKNAKITCVHRGIGFKRSDDSAFINQIFDPEFVDFIYDVPEHTRQRLLSKHFDTNYSVVDDDLIDLLYQIIYAEKITDKKRLLLSPLSNIMNIRKHHKKIKIDMVNVTNSQPESLLVDAAILATGYTYSNPPKVIEPLEKYFKKGPTGKIEIHRHYGIVTDTELRAGIYVQGCNESTHGLSDTLLSILAIRSAEIFQHLQLSLKSSAVSKPTKITVNPLPQVNHT